MKVVLIHGTTQSSAGWQRLRHALEARGCRAVAVDLPTDQPDLRAADYAELVQQQVGTDADVVVVAHSASGVLLPAIARALNARHQVWLAAWVPDSDASLIEEVEQRADVAFAPDWIGKDPTTDPAVAARFLFHDCDEKTLEWALGTVRLFLPSATYAERVKLNSTPSTYIVASYDRTLRPDWQRRMARERLGIAPVEIAAGHCPHVSQPDQLAEIVVGLD
jgi:pimeloyl-ACP methyl ester carboxylesterase